MVKDGVTQPVFSFDEAVWETVWVLSDMDSDNDGRLDRISARIGRPKETKSGLKVASIINASPYWQGFDPYEGDQREQERERKGLVTPGNPWSGWLDDYFVPRGYAVLEVEVAGTGNSQGCMGVGGVEDERSTAAVVDWLNGRTTAAYRDGTPAVASWSTGDVGMYGLSYNGSLASQLAETGIDGLKTIVPIGGPSSQYEFTRAQGIGYRIGLPPRYLEDFAKTYSNSKASQACQDKYREIGDREEAADWDYTPFFAERNYRDNADQIRASVFLVQGLLDDTVRSTHVQPYWEQLGIHNVPRKLYLHDGKHEDPFRHAGEAGPVHRWMDHWLYGVDNGIMNEPPVSIERPDGSKATEAAWPSPEASETSLHFGPAANGGAGSLTSSPVQGSQQFTNSTTVGEETMVANPGTVRDYRLAYLSPTLSSARRLSGTGRVEVTFTSSTTSTPLTALLVQYGDDGSRTVVTRGSLDAKNRNSLTTGTPLVPGEQATGTVLLEPEDHIFPAGSKIGVILTGNLSDFVYPDPEAGRVSVALGASRVVLPLTGGSTPTVGCAEPAWNATAIYNTDNVVSHGGHRWRAKWWTQNQEPGTTGPWGVWVDLGSC
ncbi:MAG TPA: CocE/NonD family hydrolase [Actinoplanes sp.]|nr:CocE/NonD family hydrolase [Actinoplanes sp.]